MAKIIIPLCRLNLAVILYLLFDTQITFDSNIPKAY